METDFGSSYVAGNGVIVFPSYPFPSTPLPPDEVVESIILTGTNVNVNQGVGGTVDD
jgi:hypothetical protein